MNRRVSLACFYSTDPIADYRSSNNNDDDDDNDGDDDDYDDDDDDDDDGDDGDDDDGNDDDDDDDGDDEGCSVRKYKISASPQQQTIEWCRISQW